MELTVINQLYLELSQIATATTAKELALQKEVEQREYKIRLLMRHIMTLEKRLTAEWRDVECNTRFKQIQELIDIEKLMKS